MTKQDRHYRKADQRCSAKVLEQKGVRRFNLKRNERYEVENLTHVPSESCETDVL